MGFIMKKIKNAIDVLIMLLIPLATLSPILYIGLFIDHEWLKYLGISILICSPVILVGLDWAYPNIFEWLYKKLKRR